MKICLVCPECGNNTWLPYSCAGDEDDLTLEAFECLACGEITAPEDMVAKTLDDDC